MTLTKISRTLFDNFFILTLGGSTGYRKHYVVKKEVVFCLEQLNPS